MPLDRSALISAIGVAAMCLSTTINIAKTQELSKQAVEAQQEQNLLTAKVAAVAVANKIARTAWVVLANGEAYRHPASIEG